MLIPKCCKNCSNRHNSICCCSLPYYCNEYVEDEVKEPDKQLYIGKVADEPDEWVLGELVGSKNPQYSHIIQKQEFPWSKCCGVGTFAVEKDSIKEVKI